ncbi:MAG: hypothetical protein CVU99_01525 [Firmicutes bacterium HGW-Firmicutes-4]|jgi:hypothetical protein|nr:MAG: hypothetical protein CVU99_01525 [Firmicutes bacterium HGW-Firmicutes-4]
MEYQNQLKKARISGQKVEYVTIYMRKTWALFVEMNRMRQRGEIVILKSLKTKGFRSLSKGLRRVQTALIRDSKGSKGFNSVFERKEKIN